MPRTTRIAWLLLATGTFAASRTLAGPVTYVSQLRTLNSNLREVFEGRGEPTILRDDDSAQAADFGDFDAAVISFTDEVPPDQPSRSRRVTGTQRSMLRDGGIAASGRFEGVTGTDEGGYNVRSLVDVTFDLPQLQTYTLTYFVDRFPQSGGFTHVRQGTQDAPGSLVDLDLVFEEFPLEDTLSGALAPGRYRFVFEHLVGGDVAVHHPYRVGLSLAGATPTLIPLPPAAAALAANAASAAGLLVARQALGRRARQGNPFKRR